MASPVYDLGTERTSVEKEGNRTLMTAGATWWNPPAGAAISSFGTGVWNRLGELTLPVVAATGFATLS
jgi:hypothetical protein